MFRKILVCLDGTDFAEPMVPYAAEVAKRFDSHLVLLEVVESASPSSAATQNVGMSGERATEALEQSKSRRPEQAREYLEGVAAGLRDQGLNVETVALEGSPARTIVDYASKNEVDLIAIATHGRKNIGRLVFGSVTDHVLRNTGLPVLSMKPKEAK
ncbi:MAG: universal stress protein [Chloroflexota bacterium]